jgi:hypothetical protein
LKERFGTQFLPSEKTFLREFFNLKKKDLMQCNY